MIRLIKNEIVKLFHKTSVYVVLIIALAFVILLNYLSSSFVDNEVVSYNEIDITSVNDFISNYNPNVDSLDEYAYNLALLDSYNLAKEYDAGSWQYAVFMDEYLRLNTEYYKELYSTKDSDTIEDINALLLEMLQKIYSDDWKYFANMDKEALEEEINGYDEALKSETSNTEIINININKNVAEERLALVEYRLEEDVSYTNDYLNQAIFDIENVLYSVAEYRYNLGADRKDYARELKTYYENKYILEEKIDTNSSDNLRSGIVNFFSNYSFLIIVFVIMVAGSIVSEEFSKGTIKSLLTVPYSRAKILTAKLITVLLSIPFIILFLLVCELIVGGITFGFSSLGIVVPTYNIATNSVDVLNVFSYLFVNTLANLPELILLALLAFTCSVLFNSTAFAITITFCGMIGSELINAFALSFDIKFLDYFVTTNWNFSYYLFGGSSPFGLTMGHSLLVCFTYLVIMITIAYAVFSNRDIKNV